MSESVERPGAKFSSRVRMNPSKLNWTELIQINGQRTVEAVVGKRFKSSLNHSKIKCEWRRTASFTCSLFYVWNFRTKKETKANEISFPQCFHSIKFHSVSLFTFPFPDASTYSPLKHHSTAQLLLNIRRHTHSEAEDNRPKNDGALDKNEMSLPSPSAGLGFCPVIK